MLPQPAHYHYMEMKPVICHPIVLDTAHGLFAFGVLMTRKNGPSSSLLAGLP